MNKLSHIINQLEKNDLEKIKLDLETGNIKRIIEKRLEISNIKTCPVCNSDFSIENIKYSLTFGPASFKKQACFDELDCMEYFINNHIKVLKE
jgi:hypothetical protein